jgi:hypothetical protein
MINTYCDWIMATLHCYWHHYFSTVEQQSVLFLEPDWIKFGNVHLKTTIMVLPDSWILMFLCDQLCNLCTYCTSNVGDINQGDSLFGAYVRSSLWGSGRAEQASFHDRTSTSLSPSSDCPIHDLWLECGCPFWVTINWMLEENRRIRTLTDYMTVADL